MQCAEYTFLWWLRNIYMQQNDGQSSLDAPGLQLRTGNVVCCFAAESGDFRVRNDIITLER